MGDILKKEPKSSPAPALERGLAMIEYVAGASDGCAYNQIVEDLSLPPASVARLIQVLSARNYLAKDERTGRYRLGAAVDRLSAATGTTAARIIEITSKPILKTLTMETESTSLVVYWDGIQLEIIAKEAHENSLAMQALGSVRSDILEYPWSPFVFRNLDEKRRMIELSKKHDVSALAVKLAKHYRYFEKHGFCFYDDKTHRRFAAPLFFRGKFNAALGLGGFPDAITNDKIQAFGKKVKAAAAQINSALADQ